MEPLNPSSCIQVLLGISRGLSHRTSIQKTLDEISAQVDKYFAPKHLAVLLVEPDTGDLAFSLVLGEKTELLNGKKLRKGGGIAGWVAQTGEPLLIQNTSSDPRFAAQFLTAKTKGSETIMAVPLKSADMVYGVIELIDSKFGATFTADNLRELTVIAEITSVALERAYYFQAMRRMAETDQLTGLPNKRSFERFLEREIEVCKRYGTPSCAMVLKLENLRGLNEEHGISTADKIIQLIGETLLAEVRKADVPCRIAANRFAVIMPNTTRTAALDVSQRVNTKIAQQAAARQLPFFSLTMDIHAGVQEDFTRLLVLSETSKVAVQGFRKFRDVASNLFQLLSEERQAMERRQYYRKKVRLAGRYENPETGETGDLLVENLSLNGLGFTPLLNHRLVKNDLVRLVFTLDDSRRTEINRLGRVRIVRDRSVGCQFEDLKTFDSDLGFYLMR